MKRSFVGSERDESSNGLTVAEQHTLLTMFNRSHENINDLLTELTPLKLSELFTEHHDKLTKLKKEIDELKSSDLQYNDSTMDFFDKKEQLLLNQAKLEKMENERQILIKLQSFNSIFLADLPADIIAENIIYHLDEHTPPVTTSRLTQCAKFFNDLIKDAQNAAKLCSLITLSLSNNRTQAEKDSAFLEAQKLLSDFDQSLMFKKIKYKISNDIDEMISPFIFAVAHCSTLSKIFYEKILTCKHSPNFDSLMKCFKEQLKIGISLQSKIKSNSEKNLQDFYNLKMSLGMYLPSDATDFGCTTAIDFDMRISLIKDYIKEVDDINAKCKEDEKLYAGDVAETILVNVCMNCPDSALRLEIVKLLLQAGADPSIASSEGFTPLMEAVNHDDLDLMDLLIRYGAKINQLCKGDELADEEDSYDGTALHHAVEGQNIDVVEMLLKNGAYTTIKNKWNKTPLDLAKQIQGENRDDEIANEIVALIKAYDTQLIAEAHASRSSNKPGF